MRTSRLLAGPPDELVYAPEVLDPGNANHRGRLRSLRDSSPPRMVYDTIRAQLRDFVRVSAPSEKFSDRAADAKALAILDGTEPCMYGRWVHYPWSRRLVHVLSPGHFHQVRHDRNQLKITTEEQQRLGRQIIGVVGLSVGSAVARTIALEGIVGQLRLADHDVLDLSNLNRLQGGIHEIGINKAVMAARQIYETNPYADIEIYPDGLNEANIDAFILGTRPLDILIDECDSLDMKLLMRERARARRIPVLMETSDRGTLDVERFDLEPERPLLHGRLGELRHGELSGLTTEQKIRHVLRIVTPEELSDRLGASMIEIGRTVSTWPQLASEVQLGGAAIATAVRRLGLGEPLPSGRRYMELSALVAVPWEAPPILDSESRSKRAVRSIAAVPPFMRCLAEHAALAPSGGNCQPWRFVISTAGELVITHDEQRSHGVRDQNGFAACFAIGAAVENARIAAAANGRDLSVTIRHSNGRVPLSVALLPGSCIGQDRRDASARLALVRARATNRRPGDGQPLEPKIAAILRDAAKADRVHLQILTDGPARAEVGRILGSFDRIQFTVPALQHEIRSEIRWTQEEARRTGDGIDLATLNLDSAKASILKLIMRGDVAALLRIRGRGAALEEMARDAMEDASAIGLLRVADETQAGFFAAGSAMQRMWLEATRMGLGIHPWTALTFVARSIATPVGDAESPDIFGAREALEIRVLVDRLDKVFDEHWEWGRAMLFRISNAVAPATRSTRRDLGELFQASRVECPLGP